MKTVCMILAIIGLSACAAGESRDSKEPLMLETAIDTDLLILKTEDIRSPHQRLLQRIRLTLCMLLRRTSLHIPFCL